MSPPQVRKFTCGARSLHSYLPYHRKLTCGLYAGALYAGFSQLLPGGVFSRHIPRLVKNWKLKVASLGPAWQSQLLKKFQTLHITPQLLSASDCKQTAKSLVKN